MKPALGKCTHGAVHAPMYRGVRCIDMVLRVALAPVEVLNVSECKCFKKGGSRLIAMLPLYDTRVCEADMTDRDMNFLVKERKLKMHHTCLRCILMGDQRFGVQRWVMRRGVRAPLGSCRPAAPPPPCSCPAAAAVTAGCQLPLRARAVTTLSETRLRGLIQACSLTRRSGTVPPPGASATGLTVTPGCHCHSSSSHQMSWLPVACQCGSRTSTGSKWQPHPVSQTHSLA